MQNADYSSERTRAETKFLMLQHYWSNKELVHFMQSGLQFLVFIPLIHWFKKSPPLRFKNPITVAIFVALVASPICLYLSLRLKKYRIDLKTEELKKKGLDNDVSTLKAVAEVTRNLPLGSKICNFIVDFLKFSVPLAILAAYIPKNSSQIDSTPLWYCAFSILLLALALRGMVNNAENKSKECETLDKHLNIISPHVQTLTCEEVSEVSATTPPVPIITEPEEEDKHSKKEHKKGKTSKWYSI